MNITDAYRSVPEQFHQNEADIPPLALYAQDVPRQHAQKTQDLRTTQCIRERCKVVAQMCKWRKRRTTGPQIWQTRQEKINKLIENQREQEGLKARERGRKDWWLQGQWVTRCDQERKRKERAQTGQERPAAWTTLRGGGGTSLHMGWSRPQSTIATLLRTEQFLVVRNQSCYEAALQKGTWLEQHKG